MVFQTTDTSQPGRSGFTKPPTPLVLSADEFKIINGIREKEHCTMEIVKRDGVILKVNRTETLK